MESSNVWLVTGASQGLGLSLTKRLLREGYRVVATSRNAKSLINEIGEESDTFLPLSVTLTDDHDVKKAIEKSIKHFGRIDVIVNNAGYGQIGTLEEISDQEARENFNVNVFGTLNVIRNAMPYLRKQGSGRVFNISSVGGYFGGYPGWGIYCATKFAVAGLTESFAEEIREFGVRATVVYPGTFRTNFLTKGSIRVPVEAIGEYTAARRMEKLYVEEINGKQSNDPEKAAEVLIAISKEENPPVHLSLGADAYDIVNKKISILTDETERWKEYTMSTGIE